MIAFDRWFEEAFFAMRSAAGVEFFSYVTAFGSASAVVIICMAFALYLLSRGRTHDIAGLFVSVASGTLGVQILKQIFERARPALPFPTIVDTTYSFPSGHAAVSVALYGYIVFIGCVASRTRGGRLLWLLGGAGVAILLGTSRLYLGMHYATDVIGGWTWGLLSLAVGILVSKMIGARRGARS